MENFLLKDRLAVPDDELVFSIIGVKSSLWKFIFNYLHENHPDISEEWKYYKKI